MSTQLQRDCVGRISRLTGTDNADALPLVEQGEERGDESNSAVAAPSHGHPGGRPS
jgi:hypothetical protein